MTTAQIWKLYFAHTKNMKVCQQRLHKLREYGLLRAIEQAQKRGEGRPPYIWALDTLGGELLVHERGVDPKLINTKPRADEDRSLSIKHILATTNVHIALQDACRNTNMTIDEWITEREVRSLRTREAKLPDGLNGQVIKVPIPDALFTLTRDGKHAIFHLEVDRATEDIELSTFERQSIAGKVIEYLLWEESDDYQREYGTRPLRVLFVTLGRGRMQNMRKAAEKILEQKLALRSGLSNENKQAELVRLGKRFRFITFEQLNPETLLTQSVWSIAGKGAGTLFE